MSGFETVIFEKDDRGIAYVTLNRPGALNAFSVQMRDDLFEVLNAVKIDDEVRTVLFKGAGDKAFCAGADLKGLSDDHFDVVVSWGSSRLPLL